MSVGDNIKTLREEKKITQEELGAAIGTTKQTIYKYEMGVITNIPLDKVEQIAKVLGVAPAQLMGWSEPEHDEKEEILQRAFDRPEMRMLFSVAERATKEDIERAIKIIEALKGE